MFDERLFPWTVPTAKLQGQGKSRGWLYFCKVVTKAILTYVCDCQSCNKSASWYLGYRTFLEENPDIFKKWLLILSYLAYERHNNVNLWRNLTPNDYKWVDNKIMFTLMPHIATKCTKNMVRTFFRWKSGYRTKIFFLQLCLQTRDLHPHSTCICRFLMGRSPATSVPCVLSKFTGKEPKVRRQLAKC